MDTAAGEEGLVEDIEEEGDADDIVKRASDRGIRNESQVPCDPCDDGLGSAWKMELESRLSVQF